MKTIVVIPSRLGSTRLPGKPLLDLCGKPVLQWVFEGAKQARSVEEVLIATDSEEIAATARAFGATVFMTSTKHESGTDRVAEVAAAVPCDFVVNVQGDEPFVRGSDIDRLDEQLRFGASMATLLAPLEDEQEFADPSVVKVVVDSDNNALYFSRSPIPHRAHARGSMQQAKAEAVTFRHLGLYGYSRAALAAFGALAQGRLERLEGLEQLRALEAGWRIRLARVEPRFGGIDTLQDLEKARQYALGSGSSR
jgi:3-deoxy-manno-octulosonate cytidylyltransferase (CMP-KDO synthetase)